MSGRRLMVGYLTVMAAFAAAFFALPDQQLLSWSAIGLTSAAAVWVGMRRHRPRRRLPWLLLAAALVAFTAGDAAWLVQVDLLRRQDPFPSVADAIYLVAFFPLAVTALAKLARTGVASRDRDSMLDGLILTAGAGLLAWTFLIRPYVDLPGVPLADRAISIAYPVFSVLILATIARLASAARWSPSVIMLVAGGFGLLVADVLYGLSQLGGGWATGGPVDLGWVVLYAGWGAAALHPSMVELTEPRTTRPGELSARRRAVLALASLLAVVVLLVEAAAGPWEGFLVAAVLTAVMLGLVLSRLSAAVNGYRRAVARERGLREAGAAMVAITSAEEVTGVVRAAVGNLLPPQTPHLVELVLAGDPLAAEPPPSDPGESAVPACHPRFIDPDSLDPVLERRLDQPMAVLHCRLAVADRTAAEPGAGGLYVAAEERLLVTLPASLEVLASQAALALERIRLTEEINQRTSEAYFRTLVHNTADVILILNDDDTIRYASPSAGGVLGAAEVAGRNLREFVQPEERVAVEQTLRELRAEPRHSTATADWAMVGSFGRRLQAEAFCRNLRGDDTVAGLVITLRDVTEQRRLQRELTHRAFHDSLTGLANRVLFQERMERAVARSRRNGGVTGLLFLDLDDFKVINDTMGHTAGDELLVAVSNRLTGLLRPEDTAARLGGDEFGALIEDARRPEDIDEVAQRVVAAFAEPFALGGLGISGAVSIGVATTAEAPTGRDLLRQADLALYVAKGAGKGQWRRYRTDRHAEVLRRMEMRAALSRAVADGAFLLEYQPIVELDTGRTAGLEALVRWHDPVRGAVPPGEFIDVAEESGLIVPIGAWVLEHALADAARWRGPSVADGGPYLSVNVSARQFRQPGFVDTVRGALETAGLPPGDLVMEITESVLMHDDEQVWTDLVDLREIGVRVAIDDFGTGYSSLRYLRQVPVDIIKIEKSFLDHISSSSSQLAVVEGIMGLAHRLGLEVVAEGIERVADRDLLTRMGCRYGQGFLFSRPLGYGDAVKWMQALDAA